MPEYRFSVIIVQPPMTQDQILDVTDALGEAGCTDASIRGHSEGLELLFERSGDNLQAVIRSAVGDVESTGFLVSRIEMEREAIPV